jgi:hypothetical protein
MRQAGVCKRRRERTASPHYRNLAPKLGIQPRESPTTRERLPPVDHQEPADGL